MMVSAHFERGVVAEMYPSKNWKKKVDRMPDGQVHAIYLKEMAKQEAEKAKQDKSNQLPF